MNPAWEATLFALLDRSLSADTTVEAFVDELIRAVRVRFAFERIALFRVEPGRPPLPLTRLSPLDFVRLEPAVADIAAGRAIDRADMSSATAEALGDRFVLVAWARDRAETRSGFGHASGLDFFVSLFADFIKRRAMRGEAAESTLVDPLTGLPSRGAVLAQLASALDAAKRDGSELALCYIDLDGFKAVNDDHGHSAGDQLLRGVAERLSHAARGGEVVGRFGGDEFAAVLPRVQSAKDAIELGLRLLESLEAPLLVEPDVAATVSASIGIAIYPHDGNTVEDLLNAADASMYRAKRNGGGNVCLYSDSMRREVERRRRLQTDLRSAQRGNELLVCFQPIVDAASGEIVAAEALARWMHPREGLLSARSFLDAIGTASVGQALDVWAVGAAVHGLRSSYHRALGAVHVNIAVPKPALLEAFDRARSEDAFGLPLHIEIPEASAIRSPDAVIAFARACRERGIGVGIDHFGLSAPNFELLERIAPDFVKLHSSLVARIDAKSPKAGRTFAAIGVAQAFGSNVIACGVTGLAQQHWLLECGVRLQQGYAVAPPMTAADLDQWLNSRADAQAGAA